MSITQYRKSADDALPCVAEDSLVTLSTPLGPVELTPEAAFETALSIESAARTAILQRLGHPH